MTNTLQTNVTLTDVTYKLLRADGGKDKERDLARKSLVAHLVKVGWTKETDADAEDRKKLRAVFSERYTDKARALLAMTAQDAGAHKTAPDHYGNEVTGGSRGGAPKNRAYWNAQITSGLNKIAIAIENRKAVLRSGGTANTKRFISVRLEQELKKLADACNNDGESSDDLKTQEFCKDMHTKLTVLRVASKQFKQS
tara:strand:+ start:275 stop:865 length:591 start_codon:yes stop_codon:yes gene_type:complete